MDRDPEVPAAAQRLAELHSVRCVAVVADVANFEDVQRAARETEADVRPHRSRRLRRGHRLGQVRLPLLEPGPERLAARAERQHRRRGQRGPRLRAGPGAGAAPARCCFASVAGQIGSQTDPPYSARRRPSINFAQCAAKDLAPYGVRVNTLCPGMVQTALNRSVWEAWNRQQPEGQRQTYEDMGRGEDRRGVTPLGRWQTPEDIAAMAVFLASARAMNVTGQTVNVDGG